MALSFGWYEFSFAFNYPSPVKTTCSDFLAQPLKNKWVKVDDCVINFSLNHKVDKSEMGVLIFSSYDDAVSDNVRTAVILKVSDPQQIEKAHTNWKLHFQTNEELNEIKYQLRNEPIADGERIKLIEREKELTKTLSIIQEKLLVTAPMILKYSYDQPRYTLPKAHLANDYFVYDYSSEDDNTPYFKGILLLLCGVLLTIGVIYTFHFDRNLHP